MKFTFYLVANVRPWWFCGIQGIGSHSGVAADVSIPPNLKYVFGLAVWPNDQGQVIIWKITIMTAPGYLGLMGPSFKVFFFFFCKEDEQMIFIQFIHFSFHYAFCRSHWSRSNCLRKIKRLLFHGWTKGLIHFKAPKSQI